LFRRPSAIDNGVHTVMRSARTPPPCGFRLALTDASAFGITPMTSHGTLSSLMVVPIESAAPAASSIRTATHVPLRASSSVNIRPRTGPTPRTSKNPDVTSMIDTRSASPLLRDKVRSKMP
jgi:hypothetical protein